MQPHYLEIYLLSVYIALNMHCVQYLGLQLVKPILYLQINTKKSVLPLFVFDYITVYAYLYVKLYDFTNWMVIIHMLKRQLFTYKCFNIGSYIADIIQK